MLSKNDLERLAEMRLNDAILLLENNKASSAYYLSGYAVELALKSVISKLFHNNVMPDKALVNAVYTHSLEQLMSSSGLLPALNTEIKENPKLSSHWGIVSKWNEGSRYEFWDPITAATLIDAIADKEHGVFEWVKSHW